MSDLCVECGDTVRPLQHALACDVCDKWQHRTCGTGVSRLDYFKARKRLIIIDFTCRRCTDATSTSDDPTSTSGQAVDTSADPANTSVDPADTTVDVSLSEAISNALHSTLAESPSTYAVPSVTFNLEFSMGSGITDVSVDDDDMSTQVAMNTTYIITPSPAEAQEAFDVTRHGANDVSSMCERSLNEDALTGTIIGEDDQVEFEVVESGTTRKMKKLVASDGFSYCVKKQTSSSIQWRCSVRRKGNLCYANVTQHGDIFKRGPAQHTHPADPLMKKRVILKRNIRQEAVKDVFAPAGRIVDNMMTETFIRGDFNLPRPAALVRTMNRARQKLRPQEPKSLDFEFNHDFLGEKFLVGDVRVGEERHMMFATSDQLRLLQRSRTWFLDGTFRVVSRPFTQLWSVHAFIRQGDTKKQVPLICVLMSRRRQQDYEAVLRKIIEILDEAPVVEAFTMDFEAGLWQALREVFPRSKLHGCGFHWAQAIQRRVQAVGLQATYERREGVHQHIRKLLALPFLPAGDIPRAFQKLRDRADGSSQPLRELFEYASDQWLESSLWSPEEWSVYRMTVRTNNDTEGWHRRLNSKAGRGNLQMYVLLGLLLQEAKLVNIHTQLVGEGVGRNRRELYNEMDMQIKLLWDEYDAHEIVCEDFLKKIGDIMG